MSRQDVRANVVADAETCDFWADGEDGTGCI